MLETAIAEHGRDRRPADRRSGDDRRVDRLVLLPPVRLPSVFGALLDDDHGGRFRIRPAGADYTAKQMYFPDTAALVTRFITEDGVGEVVDFMPPAGTAATDNHRLVRMVQCVRGRDDVRARGGTPIRLRSAAAPGHADRGRRPLHRQRAALDAACRSRARRRARWRRSTWRRRHARELRRSTAGRCAASWSRSAPPGRPGRCGAEIQRLFEETVAFWRSWLAQSTYTGRWRETLNRSAITLEADDVRARPAAWWPPRPPGSPSRWAASATGTTATPGSATHPSRCTRCCGSASPRRPRGSALWLGDRIASGWTATAARSTSCTASTAPRT